MEKGTIKCSANYIPLTPISFLERSAIVYRDRVSIVYGDLKYTWKQTHDRCLRLASALHRLGISRGDVVAALAPNIPATYELHFAVPMAGAVLCTLNIRHDSAMVSLLLGHSEAKIIFVDYQFLDTAKGALKLLSRRGIRPPHLVLIQESHNPISGDLEYESFLSSGQPDFAILRPNDEFDPISLNYTSGTTSSPKGVVYSHRGAYLNSLAAVLLNEMLSMPVYLWTVPMFHCNGWCLTWAIAAQGGTNICLRNVTARGIFESIVRHQVTHMGGAPTVLNMIINALLDEKRPLPGKVAVMTGGAPPPAPVLSRMEEMGFNVTHSYGLTETYGPGTVCTWKPEWNSLPAEERARIKARQGLHHLGMEEVDVKNPVSMQSVLPDGKTMGEVMFRGNTVMNGYLKDNEATQDAFRGGWFRSGDLGVKHEDGYIELKDRSKDIIISGGENISTIEVESVIFSHPAVLEAAVVGRPDDHWGETPCAFVKLKYGCRASGEDIIEYCRERLPRYMAPRTVVFEDLPKTSTGKTQKFVLREKAKAMGSLSKVSKLVGDYPLMEPILAHHVPVPFPAMTDNSRSTSGKESQQPIDSLATQLASLLQNLQPQIKNSQSHNIHQNISISIKLNQSNYSLWARLIKIAIGGREKLSHLTGVPPPPTTDSPAFPKWEQTDLTVYSWLLENMEPELIPAYAEYPSARALWNALQATYSQGGDSLQIFDLTVRGYNLKQGDNSVENYYSELQRIWREIEIKQPNPMVHKKDFNTFNRLRSETQLF